MPPPGTDPSRGLARERRWSAVLRDSTRSALVQDDSAVDPSTSNPAAFGRSRGDLEAQAEQGFVPSPCTVHTKHCSPQRQIAVKFRAASDARAARLVVPAARPHKRSCRRPLRRSAELIVGVIEARAQLRCIAGSAVAEPSIGLRRGYLF